MRRGTLMRCYSQHDDTVSSQIRVPFLWENSPGVSKELSVSGKAVTDRPKLTPPPSSVAKRVTHQYHEVHVHSTVTVCSLHLKGPFLYGADRVRPGDPFLAAYMKCTAASPLVVKTTSSGKGVKAKVRKYLLKLCRKYSGTSVVRDDNLITGSHNSQGKCRS